jgi:hypothetical protein
MMATAQSPLSVERWWENGSKGLQYSPTPDHLSSTLSLRFLLNFHKDFNCNVQGFSISPSAIINRHANIASGNQAFSS